MSTQMPINQLLQKIRGNNMENNSTRQSPIKMVVIGAIVLILLIWLWPLRSVPTGSRGVVTVGGAIKGIESEGFMLVAPWQSLSIFNIRAEEAAVENADGSTSDTQPVRVSLTVRYSIEPDKVAEVFEKYSHDGNLQSYVQTATQEVFKAVTARYTAPDLIGKRSLVSGDILEALRKKVRCVRCSSNQCRHA
jgi:prohibitin 2